jgi:hypothetical protein
MKTLTIVLLATMLGLIAASALKHFTQPRPLTALECSYLNEHWNDQFTFPYERCPRGTDYGRRP